jgi:hypothetical protein
MFISVVWWTLNAITWLCVRTGQWAAIRPVSTQNIPGVRMNLRPYEARKLGKRRWRLDHSIQKHKGQGVVMEPCEKSNEHWAVQKTANNLTRRATSSVPRMDSVNSLLAEMGLGILDRTSPRADGDDSGNWQPPRVIDKHSEGEKGKAFWNINIKNRNHIETDHYILVTKGD